MDIPKTKPIKNLEQGSSFAGLQSACVLIFMHTCVHYGHFQAAFTLRYYTIRDFGYGIFLLA
jgi:hypothetical protein